MNKFIACILKEWLLLFRDKLALAILFLMPVFFIIVITLFQYHSNNQKLSLLVYIGDRTKLTNNIYRDLSNNEQLKIIDAKKLFNNDFASAKKSISTGHYQVMLYFPSNISKKLQAYTKNMLLTDENNKPVAAPKVYVYFDPAINGYLKNLLLQVLIQSIQHYQLKIASQFIAKLADTQVKELKPAENLLQIEYAESKHSLAKPNSVQQNVPAWAIFGMFFIVIPISTILIKERELNINQRIFMAPVSKLTLLLSRITAFSIINLLQLLLMLLVGLYVLPILHLPKLVLYSQQLLLLSGVLTAFAATSFGLFIGSIVNSHEQASALGPLLVILAAAIGGIMLPTYLMPEHLQVLSSYSPMNWAQKAFVDIFVRQANISMVFPQLIKLVIFGLCMLILSYVVSYFRKAK